MKIYLISPSNTVYRDVIKLEQYATNAAEIELIIRNERADSYEVIRNVKVDFEQQKVFFEVKFASDSDDYFESEEYSFIEINKVKSKKST